MCTKHFRLSKLAAAIRQIKTSLSGEYWPILLVLKHLSLIKCTTIKLKKLSIFLSDFDANIDIKFMLNDRLK